MEYENPKPGVTITLTTPEPGYQWNEKRIKELEETFLAIIERIRENIK